MPMDDSVWLIAACLAGFVIGCGLVFFILNKTLTQKFKAEMMSQTADSEKEKALLTQQLTSLQQQINETKSTIHSLEQDKTELDKRKGQLETQVAVLEEKSAQIIVLQESIKTKELDLDRLRQELSIQKVSYSELMTQAENDRKYAAEKLEMLEEAKKQLKMEFENLANGIFEDKGKKFANQNQENLSILLNPLKEQIQDFKKKVEDVYVQESKDRTALHHEISSLKKLNLQMSEDAINLTKALKGETKTQGNWGEMILERVLEESGLQKGREYFVQESFVSESGKRLQPDVVVRLPEGKDVIIDSKVSLVAYERYCSAETEEESSKALDDHLQSLKSHVRSLSQKDYEKLEAINSLDFVLLFVPIEAAFLKAVESDPSLFRQAFDKNIMIVCPSTLLVTLRTIQNSWRYEYQNQNAIKIADSAGGLYDQLVLLVDAMEDVGDKISKANDAYITAKKRLVDGRGNLIRRVEQLKQLGAKAKKSLPAELVAEAEESVLSLEGNAGEDFENSKSKIETLAEE